MKKSNDNKQLLFAAGLIFLAAFTRLIPHPYNLTAIGALALFSGAQVTDKRMAFFLPFAALFLSDLVIGLHETMLPVYMCFAITVWLGSKLGANSGIIKTGLFSISGSIIFFLITNLPIWYGGFYPMTPAGTMMSYTAALPFFSNQMIGDLVYSGLLFGVFNSIKNSYLRPVV
jgi:hypothetical protein